MEENLLKAPNFVKNDWFLLEKHSFLIETSVEAMKFCGNKDLWHWKGHRCSYHIWFCMKTLFWYQESSLQTLKLLVLYHETLKFFFSEWKHWAIVELAPFNTVFKHNLAHLMNKTLSEGFETLKNIGFGFQNIRFN
jgi:hypothetical protein